MLLYKLVKAFAITIFVYGGLNFKANSEFVNVSVVFQNKTDFLLVFQTGDRANFSNAIILCNSIGMNLAEISSLEEVEFLFSFLSSSFSSLKEDVGDYWIGLHDVTADVARIDPLRFTYVNDLSISRDFFNNTGSRPWAESEPNKSPDTELCVEVFEKNGLWNDRVCSTTSSFLCSKEIVLEEPPPSESDVNYFTGGFIGILCAVFVLASLCVFGVFYEALNISKIKKELEAMRANYKSAELEIKEVGEVASMPESQEIVSSVEVPPEIEIFKLEAPPMTSRILSGTSTANDSVLVNITEKAETVVDITMNDI